MKIDVHGCQRCGHDHDVEFIPLLNPPDDFQYWGECPYTKQPVLLRVSEQGGENEC